MINPFRRKTKTSNDEIFESGFLVFESTTEVIQAEMLLKNNGFRVRVMGPPPEIQSGCDMVLEVELNQALTIERLLRQKGIEPLQYVPVDGPLLKPINLFQEYDYGEYLMVRAANMKMTVHKDSLKIVNVSGGGCPDVPYLAKLMVGEKLGEAPEPFEVGATLCGYALQLAYEELIRQLT